MEIRFCKKKTYITSNLKLWKIAYIIPKFAQMLLILPFNKCYRLFAWYFHDVSMIYIVCTWHFLFHLYFIHAKLINWRKTRQIWPKIWKNCVPQKLCNQIFASLMVYTIYTGPQGTLCCSCSCILQLGVTISWKDGHIEPSIYTKIVSYPGLALRPLFCNFYSIFFGNKILWPQRCKTCINSWAMFV